MPMNEIKKYQTNEIVKKDGAVRVTNKLLALAEPQLIPYRKKEKWGFCDKFKNIKIDCIYDGALPFVDKIAVIFYKYDKLILYPYFNGQKWGYKDEFNRNILST